MTKTADVRPTLGTQAFTLRPNEPAHGEYPWHTRVMGDRTGGLLAIGEAHMPPYSSGPPLHVHSREDEAAYVVEGVLTVVLGKERLHVMPGGIAWLPRGVPHTFVNDGSSPVRSLGLIVPGGLEHMLAEEEAYFKSLQGPPDLAALAAMMGRYGVTALGPPVEPQR